MIAPKRQNGFLVETSHYWAIYHCLGMCARNRANNILGSTFPYFLIGIKPLSNSLLSARDAQCTGRFLARLQWMCFPHQPPFSWESGKWWLSQLHHCWLLCLMSFSVQEQWSNGAALHPWILHALLNTDTEPLSHSQPTKTPQLLLSLGDSREDEKCPCSSLPSDPTCLFEKICLSL